MDNYKINYIFAEETDINDILIKVLNIELKKHLEMICKNIKNEIPELYTQFTIEGGKNC